MVRGLRNQESRRLKPRLVKQCPDGARTKKSMNIQAWVWYQNYFPLPLGLGFL